MKLTAKASLVGLVAAIAAPGVVSAASSSSGLTDPRDAEPDPDGEAVLVNGQLNTAHHASQKIVLHARVNPTSAFKIEQSTVTAKGGERTASPLFSFVSRGGRCRHLLLTCC